MNKLSDYDFTLPKALIAKYPMPERSASRLLHLGTQLEHRKFTDLTSILRDDDVLVINNTRVIPARLYGQKESGGQIEILIERVLTDNSALAHIRASKAPKPDSRLIIDNKPLFKVLEKANDLYHIETLNNEDIHTLLNTYGEMPLPTYLERQAQDEDAERYQTVYSKIKGSVAAPTAGLHFDDNLLIALQNKGISVVDVTLHVGAGTFQPVRHENIADHKIHYERLYINEAICETINTAKKAGRRIVCVGTTSVRALETAADRNGYLQPYHDDTNLFIYPGYTFKIVDALITNFHLPKSSLLMLVCALGGYDRMMSAYQTAIDNHYRFYSYGDAMFIE